MNRRNLIIVTSAIVLVCLIVLGSVLTFICAAFGVFAWSFPPTYPDRDDYLKYEQVVENIRKLDLAPGSESRYRINLNNPQTVKPITISSAWPRTGVVSVRTDTNGDMTIIIVTNDQGHLGSYGFAYSDIPLKVVSEGDRERGTPDHVSVPGRLFLTSPDLRINDHWWIVFNNLN